MNRKQTDHLAIAHDYELTAAFCLATGQVDAAEYVLALADELCEQADRDEGASAA